MNPAQVLEGRKKMIGNMRLLIPSGQCPVVLESYDYESVESWIGALNKRKPENQTYEPSVYRYWLLKFFSFNSQEYKKADSNISAILGSNSRIFDLVEKRTLDEKR